MAATPEPFRAKMSSQLDAPVAYHHVMKLSSLAITMTLTMEKSTKFSELKEVREAQRVEEARRRRCRCGSRPGGLDQTGDAGSDKAGGSGARPSLRQQQP